jgi:CRP-like cAMP-binding protein
MSDAPTALDLPLLDVVDEPTRRNLLQDAKLETVDDDGVIFRQGDRATVVVFVVRGFVKLLRIASCGDRR